MHRVVVYRDGGDKGGQMVPYTTVAPQGSTISSMSTGGSGL